MAAQTVAGTFDLNDDGVMKQPIQKRGGDDGIAEDITPCGKASARCEDHRGLFIACVHELPAQLVPDTLKAGVTKACFYDPAINRTYGDMASHYDTAIIPARPHKAACRDGITVQYKRMPRLFDALELAHGD